MAKKNNVIWGGNSGPNVTPAPQHRKPPKTGVLPPHNVPLQVMPDAKLERLQHPYNPKEPFDFAFRNPDGSLKDAPTPDFPKPPAPPKPVRRKSPPMGVLPIPKK